MYVHQLAVEVRTHDASTPRRPGSQFGFQPIVLLAPGALNCKHETQVTWMSQFVCRTVNDG